MQLLYEPYESIATIAAVHIRRLISTKRCNISTDSLIEMTPYFSVKEYFKTTQKESHRTSFNKKWLSEYQSKEAYPRAEMIKHIKSGNVKEFLRGKILNDSVHYSIKNEAFSKYCEFYPSDKWEMVSIVLQDSNMSLQSLATYEILKINDSENLIIDKRTELLNLCQEAIQKLQLPRQAETFIDLNKAIAKLSGKKTEPFKTQYNHPIDWEFVRTIPSDQRVMIETNKGNIILELFVDNAPGTVSNFIKLMNEGYYDNKYFHRVVPQFVIQGGCPRGDGWGSLNWTQRSEFSHYTGFETGTIGIASAGKDTEGVQFFITHCPTPFLDGRYTAFGQVTQGMNVVQQIRIGDVITSIHDIQ